MARTAAGPDDPHVSAGCPSCGSSRLDADRPTALQLGIGVGLLIAVAAGPVHNGPAALALGLVAALIVWQGAGDLLRQQPTDVACRRCGSRWRWSAGRDSPGRSRSLQSDRSEATRAESAGARQPGEAAVLLHSADDGSRQPHAGT